MLRRSAHGHMINDLRACKTRRGFAKVLNIPEKELTFALYSKEAKPLYKNFCISKKSGGTRLISAPNAKLKFIQRRLLSILQECDSQIRSKNHRSSNYLFGFRKETGIWHNAKRHCKKRFVLNIDIKDYFDQINFGRVRGFFINSKDFSLHEDVATVLAQIVCHENKLPQGAPTSPLVAGLVTEFFDVRLSRFLRDRDCSYSRYCDDITISTSMKAFPLEVAVQDDSWLGGWKLSEELEGEFERAGLPINYDKVRMSEGSSQKMVTGLVVNRYPNVPARYYNDTRVWLDHYARTGIFSYKEFCNSFGSNCAAEDDDLDETEEDTLTPEMNVVDRLGGRLAHIVQMRSQRTEVPYPSQLDPENPQFWSLLQKFVFVRNFVANDYATAITEGPSDIIHIKAAIRLNPEWAPNIYNEDEKKYKIKFFPHGGLFARSVGICGGAGDIGRFLDFFYQPPKRINLGLRKNSVILITDNDKACGKIFNRLNNAHKLSISWANPQFSYKLQKHFYLLKAPHVGGKKETCIEDMLKPHDLKEAIHGKVFEPDDKKFDPAIHLSKVAFASALSKQNDKSKYSEFEEYIKALDQCVAQNP